MAKKKVVKESVKEKSTTWDEAHNGLVDRIEAIEQRIDSIVLAHEKCKSLKGL